MIRHLLIIGLLTALTQLGGIAWALALLLRRAFGRFLMWFVALYLALGVLAHYTAPLAGRVPLPCLDAGPAKIAVLNPLYCALNRNYVSPQMKSHADALAAHMHADFPGTRTRALDGNFPFLDGFALLPHLSHDDGNALDLALFYTHAGRYQLGKARSPIGYWAYEHPRPGDPQPCADQSGLSLRWDMGWIQGLMRDWTLDTDRTGSALGWPPTPLAQTTRFSSNPIWHAD